jgi:hypothetical protein
MTGDEKVTLATVFLLLRWTADDTGRSVRVPESIDGWYSAKTAPIC